MYQKTIKLTKFTSSRKFNFIYKTPRSKYIKFYMCYSDFKIIYASVRDLLQINIIIRQNKSIYLVCQNFHIRHQVIHLEIKNYPIKFFNTNMPEIIGEFNEPGLIFKHVPDFDYLIKCMDDVI